MLLEFKYFIDHLERLRLEASKIQLPLSPAAIDSVAATVMAGAKELPLVESPAQSDDSVFLNLSKSATPTLPQKSITIPTPPIPAKPTTIQSNPEPTKPDPPKRKKESKLSKATTKFQKNNDFCFIVDELYK